MVGLNWPQLQRSRAYSSLTNHLTSYLQSELHYCTCGKAHVTCLMKFIPNNNYRCGKLERMQAVDRKQAIYQARPKVSMFERC